MAITATQLGEFIIQLRNYESPLHSASTDVTTMVDFDYEELGETFSQFRATAISSLQSKITHLRTEDPLNPIFLGISLLQILDGTGLRETAHTRLLTWFMNPSHKESHGFGSALLKAFLLRITGGKWDIDADLTVKTIEAERMLKHTGNQRRTDIWIEGTSRSDTATAAQHWLVVVEAKVDAAESDMQLDDYENEAKEWQKYTSGEVMLVFLTEDGKDPKTSKTDKWFPLSFLTLAEVLWSSAKEHHNAPGIHLLRHYLCGVLEDIYGWKLPIRDDNDLCDIYETLGFLSETRTQ